MGKLPVVLQVYSVRDFAENDLQGTLKQVKEMGYDLVELAGLYGNTPEDFRAALDAAGLTAISAHVPYQALSEDMDATIAAYKTLGCKFVAIPFLDDKTRPGSPDFPKTVEMIQKIGAAAKAAGMQLLYHNHDFEFVKMEDGRYGLDYLYESVSADLLQTEIDTCWVNVAIGTPVDYVLKYKGRAPVVHLKDYYSTNETGVGARGGDFEFRPVGHGIQDMPAILKASIDAGAQYVVVEQDRSVGRTSLEAVKMSRDYLLSQGF